MGSRLKQNPERTFYWFFEAACPVARDKDPDVLFQFPEDFSDEDSCQTLPRFCFPYDIQRVRDGVAVQHFTFVLTDLQGCQRFGFCRLTNNTHTCLCILSYLPWFEVFYKLLNNLADYLTKGQTNETKVLLAALYKQPLPLAAGSVTLQMVPYFIAPDPRSLPSIPENRNLTELIVAVDVGNLLQVYASLLFERRILILASKLSTLTSCVHALSAVLFPMYWQHIFIPVLPPHLLDYCCAPMPYLIGVHTSLSERVRSRGLEEVVILNVDTNTLENPFDDHKRIPSDVMSGLKLCLKRHAVSPGCGVSRAFLRAQALLFGGYRDALQGPKGDVCFSEELFLDHKSHSMRQFLQSAVHLQCFKQFIDGRLDILNKGKEPDDLFEDEILKCETTAGQGKSYQQLVGNLKKGGGALILNMKSKANMRAKGLTKSGLKNFLMHKAHNEDPTLHRVGSVSHRRAKSDCLQNRLPITQHFGMSRPRRPVHKSRHPRDRDIVKDTGDTWDGAGSGSVDESDPQLQRGEEEEEEEEEGEEEEEEEEDALLCDPEEMDLLGEIFDTLSSRSCHDRGLLYGTRSLDLFGPDNHDYITKRGPVNPSQESLYLSISGSLHSWNLETTEELADLTEDSDDWSCLETNVPEEGGPDSLLTTREKGKQEKEQREDGEKQEEVRVAIDAKEEEEKEKGNSKEVRFEEETKKEGVEMRVSLGEEPMKETAEKQDDARFKENRGDDESEQVVEKEAERETNKIQKDVTRGEDGNKMQGEEEVTRSSNKLNACDDTDTVEVWQGQHETANPETTAPSGPQSITADLKPPAGQQKKSEEPVMKELRQTPSPPKVLSAIARFQSQTSSSQSFQVKSRTKGFTEHGRECCVLWSKESKQTHQPCQSNIPDEKRSETQTEDDPPLIKVSELKKRFEA